MKRLHCGLVVLGVLFASAGQGRPDFIYWTDFDSGDIRQANLDGSGQTTLVSGLVQPAGLILDLAGARMYWAQGPDNGPGDIRSANLDGSGQTTLISGVNSTPRGIALDVPGAKMYWTGSPSNNPGDIRRANLDGSEQEILVSGLITPYGFTLDLAGGKMYWAERDLGDIRRANLDGSGQETLFTGLPGPLEIAFDLAAGKMYWADANGGDIRRVNLDGTGQEILITGLAYPVGIELDLARGQMYWTDFQGGDIRRANLDGSGQETLVTGLPGPVDVRLVTRIPVPQPILVTGYSADVMSDKDPPARFARSFDGSTFGWFEAGAVDDNGGAHTDGLPASLPFVSATARGATYQIQPANANNVLQLGAGITGTLILTTPAAYSTLYVIASSGDGMPSSVGSGTITFADGSTQVFSYNSFDWCNGQGSLHPEAVLPGPNGRANVGPDGTAFVYNQDCDFQIYETVIALDPSHAGVAITSIDFTGAPDAFWSNIFGVSGL